AAVDVADPVEDLVAGGVELVLWPHRVAVAVEGDAGDLRQGDAVGGGHRWASRRSTWASRSAAAKRNPAKAPLLASIVSLRISAAWCSTVRPERSARIVKVSSGVSGSKALS